MKLLPEERELMEHFAELDRPSDLVSGPFPLICRRALQLDDEIHKLKEVLHEVAVQSTTIGIGDDEETVAEIQKMIKDVLEDVTWIQPDKLS